MRAAVRGLLAATVTAGLAALPSMGSAAPGPSDLPQGQWVAGDLHVHTVYSHDSWDGTPEDDPGPSEFWTLGQSVDRQFFVASTRGLDFLAITDHNDIRSQSDPGFGAHGVTPLAAYENSLHGHAQMLGATRIYDKGDSSAASIATMAEALREGPDHGAFQINHPAESQVHPDDPDWGYGYNVLPDAVEVWNISRLWQPPLPSASSNAQAVRYWEGWLDRGARVAATGGSDNHWVSTTAVQGVGQPTTWVFVTDPSPAGILEGIRAGRTTISHQPPVYGGGRVYLEADGDGNGTWESMVGDDVPSTARFRARAIGTPGALLRVVGNGGSVLGEVPVTGHEFTHEFSVPTGTTWVRTEVVAPDGVQVRSAACDPLVGNETTYCRDEMGVLALSSAIYVG